MLEIISKIFDFYEKNRKNKVIISLLILLSLFVIFYFAATSPSPSLEINSKKYETLNNILTIIKDSSISVEIRDQAKEDFKEIAKTQSLDRYSNLLSSDILVAISKISSQPRSRFIPSSVVVIYNWVAFAFSSSFIFLGFASLLVKSYNNDFPNSNRAWWIVRFLTILFVFSSIAFIRLINASEYDSPSDVGLDTPMRALIILAFALAAHDMFKKKPEDNAGVDQSDSV